MEISRSARLYQERKRPEFEQTRRAPGPRADLEHNLVHIVPAETLPEVLLDVVTQPDAGLTQPWPNGQ